MIKSISAVTNYNSSSCLSTADWLKSENPVYNSDLCGLDKRTHCSRCQECLCIPNNILSQSKLKSLDQKSKLFNGGWAVLEAPDYLFIDWLINKKVTVRFQVFLETAFLFSNYIVVLVNLTSKLQNFLSKLKLIEKGESSWGGI